MCRKVHIFFRNSRENCCYQSCSFFTQNMHQIFCRLGLRPRPHWGAHSAHQTHSCFRGLFLRKGRRGVWEGRLEDRGGAHRNPLTWLPNVLIRPWNEHLSFRHRIDKSSEAYNPKNFVWRTPFEFRHQTYRAKSWDIALQWKPCDPNSSRFVIIGLHKRYGRTTDYWNSQRSANKSHFRIHSPGLYIDPK